MKKITLCVWWAKGRREGNYFTERNISDETFLAIKNLHYEHPELFDYENVKLDLSVIKSDECHRLYDELINSLYLELYNNDDFIIDFDTNKLEDFIDEFKQCGYKTGVDIAGCYMPYESQELDYYVKYSIGGNKNASRVYIDTTENEILALYDCCINNVKIFDCQKLNQLVCRIKEKVVTNSNGCFSLSDLQDANFDIEIPDDIEFLASKPDLCFDDNGDSYLM